MPDQGPGHLGPVLVAGLQVEEVEDDQLSGEHVQVGLPLQEGDRGDGGRPGHLGRLGHVPEGPQAGAGWPSAR